MAVIAARGDTAPGTAFNSHPGRRECPSLGRASWLHRATAAGVAEGGGGAADIRGSSLEPR